MNRIPKIHGICIALFGLCCLGVYLVVQKTVFYAMLPHNTYNEYDQDQSNSDDSCEVVLAFPETKMTSADITGSQPGAETVHLTDPGDVGKYVDAMHELKALKVCEDRSELTMAENYTVLSFTDEDGKVKDYKFVGEYLIYNDDVYHIENREALDVLEKMFD